MPGRDSACWRHAGDPRVLAAAGYALLLQVSHPVVAAGVREHSDYASDPWGRLLRTLDYANLLVYGGPEAASAAAGRLRATHRRIRGTLPDGDPYSALDPEPFAWVHATLVEAMVSGHRRFGRDLGNGEIERLYTEWMGLGRLIGIGEDDLPSGWAAFCEYRDRMVGERLEDNDVVQGVLASLRQPDRPPLPLLGEPAWRVGRIPLTRVLWLATAGLLPAPLRGRLGIGWGRFDELQLGAIGAAARSMSPFMRGAIAVYGPLYLRLRSA